jgi:ATP-dependent DNA helicase RecQ
MGHSGILSDFEPLYPKTPLEILQTHWNYSRFRPLQQETIACILAQQDSLTLLPTGGGKSLCYQLPILMMLGKTAVVVSPLIALMEDQVQQAKSKGIKAVALNSAQPLEIRREIFEAFQAGEVNLLYVSPERFTSMAFVQSLQRSGRIAYFAVDEAHCLSQWGHQFRPDYQLLGQLKTWFPQLSIHAFTATAPKVVADEIGTMLKLVNPTVLKSSLYRANLYLGVVKRPAKKTDFQELLVTELLNRRGQAGIIYCFSRLQVEEWTNLLQANGIKAKGYHAGMSTGIRQKNQQAFMAGAVDVMVATVAFGMGIDRGDIRFVMHTHAPRSIEHYLQEVGRAGRDGNPSDCLLYYTGRDFMTWEGMLKKDERGETLQRSLEKLWQMQLFAEGADCRHNVLAQHFGMPLPSSNCHGCDACHRYPKMETNSVLLAQQVLSAVWRTGQYATRNTVVSLLLGDAALLPQPQVATWQAFPIFGLLKNASSRKTLQLAVEQLIALGLLVPTLGVEGGLTLTSDGQTVLRAFQQAKTEAGLPPDVQQQLASVKLYASVLGDYHHVTDERRKMTSSTHGAGQKPRPERLILPTMGIAKPVKKKKRTPYAYQD